MEQPWYTWGIPNISRTVSLTGSDLVLQANAAGEGNSTGLQTRVGVRTLKVGVTGPVFIAFNSTALELQSQWSRSTVITTVKKKEQKRLLTLKTRLHLLLDEVNGVLQVLVLPVSFNCLHHEPLSSLHHLKNKRTVTLVCLLLRFSTISRRLVTVSVKKYPTNAAAICKSKMATRSPTNCRKIGAD